MRTMEKAYTELPKLWSQDNVTIIQGQLTLVHSVFDEFRRVLDSIPSLRQRGNLQGCFQRCQVLLQDLRYGDPPVLENQEYVEQLARMARPTLETLHDLQHVTFTEMIQLLNLRSTRLDGKTYGGGAQSSPQSPRTQRHTHESSRSGLLRTPPRMGSS